MQQSRPGVRQQAPERSASQPPPSRQRVAQPAPQRHASTLTQHSATPAIHKGTPAVQPHPERPTQAAAGSPGRPGSSSRPQTFTPRQQQTRAAYAGARQAARPDTRIGGAASHTQGLQHGLALAQALPPRPFLRSAGHRDPAADRAFLARHEGDFHTRQVRDFNPHELAAWRAGVWRNEWHYGRRGWWWEADGAWYSYPQPVFPYPVEVVEPVVYGTPVIDGPDLSSQEGVAEAAGDPAAPPDPDSPALASGGVPATDASSTQPAAPDIPPLPPAPVGWYRCYTPSGVYPGVQSCGMAWQLVQTAPLPGEF